MSADDDPLAEHVRKVVDAAPPLRPEQVAKLSALLDANPVARQRD